MSTLLSILSFGFLLGVRHATDADHVVAVTTIVSKAKHIRHSTLVGILWGLGHSTTVTLVGIPIMLFSLTLPPRVGLGFEFAVGCMLVILGVLNLSGMSKNFMGKYAPITIHTHEHETEKGTHNHLHIHFFHKTLAGLHHLGKFQMLRPVLIGLIHGLAGSAAIALLILSTITDVTASIWYLILFNLGVIIGMMLITTLLGATLLAIKRNTVTLHKYLVILSGIASIGFGLWVMYETGISGGLFGATIHWTPA